MRIFVFALLVSAACGARKGDGDQVDASHGSNAVVVDAALECDPAAGNACDGSNVVTCNSDGTYGSVVQMCGSGEMCALGGSGSGSGSGASCTAACTADGVDYVYVVDEQNHFLKFDPRQLPNDPFTLIGTLNCPSDGMSIQANGTTASPFSMSVDRNGVAWVLYTTGELFNVSLTTAACTKANNTIGASGMELFGMGFVTITAGGSAEDLYLAGGGNNAQPNGKLAYDDTHGGNLTPTVVGTLTATSDYSPELTGTNEGLLYGFYPNINNPAYVQEIDKTSGAPVGSAWDLGSAGLGDNITDWAFAQWGGTFWVFVTTGTGNTRNSTVRSIVRSSGAYSVVEQNLTYYIDGAGVSTCAPTVIE
jgi:hypothetical protein